MSEYPLILTYSYAGNIVTVRCDNEEQADMMSYTAWIECNHLARAV